MNKLQAAVLQTSAYADIFDYPLSAPEVWRFLVAQRKTSSEEVQKELKWMKTDKKLVGTDGEFYFLKGRKDIVSIRKKRKRWSKEKMMIARRVAGWLKLIPTIKMVAVTGALAMENSDKEDDVDLLIVTAKNRLWLSRGLVVTFLRLFGLYRRPHKIKDMICPNVFLDEAHLAMPKKERDLFSAHEVCQLKLLWEKDKIYQKFIKENQWVKRFLPNWKP